MSFKPFTQVCAVALLALSTLPAHSADFTGKRIEVTVGTAPGGANDLVARLVARHLPNALPGRPNMIVTNMPGAGGIIQANFMAFRAPNDGTSIGYINRQVIMQQLASLENVRFDASRFKWIGGLSKEAIIVFIHRSKGFASIDEMKKSSSPIIFAVRATGGTDYLAGKAIEALGVPTKIVSGYGAGQTTIAFEQGEFDASALAETAFKIRKEWTKTGGIAVPVLSLGAPVENVPYGGDQKASESRAQIYALIDKALGLPLATFAGPPEMSVDVTNSYEAAFAAMTKQAAFLDEAGKSGIEISHIDGATVTQLYKDFLNAPDASKKEFAEIIK